MRRWADRKGPNASRAKCVRAGQAIAGPLARQGGPSPGRGGQDGGLV
jgi:hypothetical protein